MEIGHNKVVNMHYQLSADDGSVSESSRGGEPVAYLHGHGGLVPGLEKALEGRKAGESFSVSIPPGDGYGEIKPQEPQRVPIKHLVRPGKLSVGKSVVVDNKSGRYQATVVKVGRFNVDLDLNHPLAGKTLEFEIEIVDVRDATPEELEHGHAHGPGGAHH